MNNVTAVVIGATGLIGEHLVQQLLQDPVYSKVRILVRRPLVWQHPKLEVAIVDFENLRDFRQQVGHGQVLFCCIGTTRKKVGNDMAAYRKVDVDIPVHAAQIAHDAGFEKYMLVSAVGAHPQSRNFYLRFKGEVEQKIAALHFQAFHTFRPGILLGHRKENRPGERIGKAVISLFNPLLRGNLARYKGINAADVAKAMRKAALTTERGMIVHHYRDMIRITAE